MHKKNRAAYRHTFRYKNTLFLCTLVLLSVAVVSIVNFLILYTNTMKTTQNDLRMESERTVQTLNIHLNSMSKIVSLKRTDKTFSVKTQAETGSAYYPIIQKLREDAMWASFFSTVSYYNTQNGLVYQMNSAKSSDEYFGNGSSGAAYSASGSLELQPWDRESLEKEGNHIRTIRIRHADNSSDGVLFAVPLEVQSGSPPLSYMLFTISDNMLFNTVNASAGTTCVLLYNGAPIYSSDPEICESLYNGEDIPEAFRSPDTLTYGSEGIQIRWSISRGFLMQKLIPTIILEGAVTFFVMAVGLMLMLYISRKTYEPVQKLLKKLPPLSGGDYPMDEFKYINFALDDLAYSKHFFEESVQELRREKYLFYILDNQVETEKALYSQCLHEGIRVDRTYFACVLMEDSEKNYALFEKLTSEEESDETKTNVYSLYIMENKYLFLLASDMPKEEFKAYLSGLAGEDPELVRISEVIEGIQNVRQAYTSVCWPEKRLEISPSSSQYPLVELQLIQEAVETENIDKVEFALRMIKNDMDGYTPATRKTVMKKVYDLLCQGNGEMKFDPPDTSGECTLLLDEWLMQFVGVKKDKPLPVKKTLPRNLHTIMHFIEEHFTSPEFSIKYMAAVFGTSPSNLSHQFKKLTGKTLSRFIDELRISKAEEMLAAGEKIQAIAQKLGYSTTPVFTETYKRLRGITPSQYRSQIQQKDKKTE